MNIIEAMTGSGRPNNAFNLSAVARHATSVRFFHTVFHASATIGVVSHKVPSISKIMQSIMILTYDFLLNVHPKCIENSLEKQ